MTALSRSQPRRLQMSRVASLLSCVALICLGSVSTSAADPLTITAGTIWVTRPGDGPAVFTAVPGFSFVGLVDRFEGRVDPFTECSPCLPGSTISVGANLSGSALPGFVTFGGTTYPTGLLDSPAALMLEFTGQAVVPASSRFPVLVSAPFTVAGQLLLTAGVGSRIPMVGSGIVSMVLRNSPFTGTSSVWEADQVRYDFSESAPPPPTPVPEPATLGTIALGLSMLARAGHTRRRHQF
jgi:hypothetical protein